MLCDNIDKDDTGDKDGKVTEVTRVMGLAKVKKVEGITEVQLVATATMIQPWMAVKGRQN